MCIFLLKLSEWDSKKRTRGRDVWRPVLRGQHRAAQPEFSQKLQNKKDKMHKCFSLFYFHWVIICGLFTYSKDDDITRSRSLLELWSKKVWNLLMRKTQVYINLQNAVNSTGYRKETRKIEFFNIHGRKELYIMFQARSISCVRFHRGL